MIAALDYLRRTPSAGLLLVQLMYIALVVSRVVSLTTVRADRNVV